MDKPKKITIELTNEQFNFLFGDHCGGMFDINTRFMAKDVSVQDQDKNSLLAKTLTIVAREITK